MWWHTHRNQTSSCSETDESIQIGGASIQLTTGSRGVHISGSNAASTMFRGSVKSIGYQLHSPVSRSLPLPSVTVCHHTFFLPFNFQPSWFVQTLLIVYSRAMLKSNGNKASPCFRLSLKETCHTSICLSGLYSQFHLNMLSLQQQSRYRPGGAQRVPQS